MRKFFLGHLLRPWKMSGNIQGEECQEVETAYGNTKSLASGRGPEHRAARRHGGDCGQMRQAGWLRRDLEGLWEIWSFIWAVGSQGSPEQGSNMITGIFIILKDHFSCKMEKELQRKKRDLSGQYLYWFTREPSGLDSGERWKWRKGRDLRNTEIWRWKTVRTWK